MVEEDGNSTNKEENVKFDLECDVCVCGVSCKNLFVKHSTADTCAKNGEIIEEMVFVVGNVI